MAGAEGLLGVASYALYLDICGNVVVPRKDGSPVKAAQGLGRCWRRFTGISVMPKG